MVVPEIPGKLPDFVSWPSFPFEGDLRVKPLEPVADVEPPRDGEDIASCPACAAPDEAYIWVSERWRVRAMDRPSGLPMVLILESRSHLDLGDLPNLLAAELGVMTVRLERAVRSLDGVARVHVNRWGDGSAHLHLWFLARPQGRLQLRGSFLSLWNDILPAVPDAQWRENLALVAAWLAEFGGRPLAEPPRIQWQAPSKFATSSEVPAEVDATPTTGDAAEAPSGVPTAPAIGRATVDPSMATGNGTPSVPGTSTTPDPPAPAAPVTPPRPAVPAAEAATTASAEAAEPEVATERLNRSADRQPVPTPRTSPETSGVAAGTAAPATSATAGAAAGGAKAAAS
jgi:hypothetical protein